jgi:hypothetical protein
LTVRLFSLAALSFVTLTLSACAYVTKEEHQKRLDSISADLEFGQVRLSHDSWSQCAEVTSLSATIPVLAGSADEVTAALYRWEDGSEYVAASFVIQEESGAHAILVDVSSPDGVALGCDESCSFELGLIVEVDGQGEIELDSRPLLTMPLYPRERSSTSPPFLTRTRRSSTGKASIRAPSSRRATPWV